MEQLDGLQAHCHCKILFGPMLGTELLLPGGRDYFLCIGKGTHCDTPPGTQMDHSLRHAVDTLYIPHHEDGPNIRLHLKPEPQEWTVKRDKDTAIPSKTDVDFNIDVFSGDGTERHDGLFNTVCQFGEIAFALKKVGDSWSDEVVNYIPGSPSPLPTQHAEDCSTAKDGKNRWAFPVKLICLMTLGSAIAVVAYWQIAQYIRNQKIASLSKQLEGSPARNHLLPGKDGTIYVLSESDEGMEWDKQALLKAPPVGKTRVLAVEKERQRLEALLNKQSIAFYTVRLEQPDLPEVVLVSSPPVDGQDAAVLKTLTAAAPYAKQIRLVQATPGTAEQEARQALNKLAIDYRQISQGTSATFEIQGAVGDAELAALRRLIGQFSRKWGTRRVKFTIVMRTDWLKGKSYQDGKGGYVLINPAYWYFPQPLKGVQ